MVIATASFLGTAALMAARLLALLTFALLCRSSASGAPVPSPCRFQEIGCAESPSGRLFFVDRKAVDCDSFCKALGAAIRCSPRASPEAEEKRRLVEEHCHGGSSSGLRSPPVGCIYLRDELRRPSPGRESLLQQSGQNPVSHELRGRPAPAAAEHIKGFSLTPERMVMASSWFLLLSCALMCPCFYAKRKEEPENSYKGRNLQSMDLDVSSHSERNPGTPHRALASPQRALASPQRALASPRRAPASPRRAPASPLRATASPLRVPLSPSRFSLSPQLSRVSSVHLTFDQIVKATQNFSSAQKIGEGGFGTVYKAVLPDGQTVAIKRARKQHFAALRTEFSNEVDLLAKIEHRCLVKLLGFIDNGNEKIIITEYVPNGTLREHLDAPQGEILDFNQRMEIAIDIAHGLTYLHLYAERVIIHRDVKSSNILLTENLRAKVADFGFAKVGHGDAGETHYSTKVKGTFGYLDPEYLRTNQLTPKSDVFSFGVLLIEILSGRRPVDRGRPADERLTVKWAFKKYNEGKVREIMDPLLREEVDGDVLSRLFNLAFRCAASTRGSRPSMNEVGERLWEIRKDYGKSLQRG